MTTKGGGTCDQQADSIAVTAYITLLNTIDQFNFYVFVILTGQIGRTLTQLNYVIVKFYP